MLALKPIGVFENFVGLPHFLELAKPLTVKPCSELKESLYFKKSAACVDKNYTQCPAWTKRVTLVTIFPPLSGLGSH